MGRPLGQHFLADRAILDAIVAALVPQFGDVVLEDGAGTGSLTRRLAPRVGRVVTIERDRKLAAALRGAADPLPSNVELVEGDALDLDWHGLLAAGPPSSVAPAAFKVVGNIPYYVTSPLLDKALTPPLPAVIVYLVQREVADRLAAAPGSRTFGALTAGVQAVATVERIRNVAAGAFRPPPRVGSAVVRLTPREPAYVAPAELPGFRAFLARLFGQRRKQLRRSLQNLTGLDAQRVEAILGEVGVAPEDRPEMLTPQELVTLHRAVGSLTETRPGPKL